MGVKDYIKYLLSIESYSFSLEEIAENTDGKGTSLKFALSRLIEKKEIRICSANGAFARSQ